MTREGRLHGLALWFDATFNPMLYDEDEAAKIQKVCQANLTILDYILRSFLKVVLGTGPRDVPTHWKQTVLLLLGEGGQTLEEDEVCPKRLPPVDWLSVWFLASLSPADMTKTRFFTTRWSGGS